VAGVTADKTRAISSAVDKLDKAPWAEVKKEMVEEKGLPEEVADKIGEYVKQVGNLRQTLDFLKADAELPKNDDVKAGIDEMELLLSYLEAYGVADKVSFDLSLARGLDYYTGVIYEAIVNPPAEPAPTASKDGGKSAKAKKSKGGDETQVGTIAAGGRYDNLVGMYGKKQIPCVGISFGVDRIFTILKAKQARGEVAARESQVDVYVMAAGGKDFNGAMVERMRIVRQLWDAGVRAEFQAKVRPKNLLTQFKAAGDTPLAVILGQDEMAAGKVKLRPLGTGKEGEGKDQERSVDLADLVAEVKAELAKLL
jgi:histidyl-tRNA synthetase